MERNWEPFYRYKDQSDIGQLRCDFYSKQRIDGDLLPPTPDVLKFKLVRSNFVALIQKRKIASFSPEIPVIAEKHGCKMEDGQPVELMADQLPVPQHLSSH